MKKEEVLSEEEIILFSVASFKERSHGYSLETVKSAMIKYRNQFSPPLPSIKETDILSKLKLRFEISVQDELKRQCNRLGCDDQQTDVLMDCVVEALGLEIERELKKLFLSKGEVKGDAVEFAEWLTVKYVLFYNPDKTKERSWFEKDIDENDIVFYNCGELYRLFLASKGLKGERKVTDQEIEDTMTLKGINDSYERIVGRTMAKLMRDNPESFINNK